ncbi:MAG: lactate utilization protein [Clostridia bacterium]|nr:lactate utilization protein [Clostridia bacterium]
MQNVANALKNNNMDAFCVETKKDALSLLKNMLIPGETVAVGGSVTLDQVGVIELLKNGDYNFIDRYESGISPEEIQNRFRMGLLADTFISSSNAITKNGCLYNVDGNGNRVAALIYGPKQVIIIAGKNKIVEDLKAAELRIKTIATPKNCKRLGIKSYCSTSGKCLSLNNQGHEMCDGCNSDSRICCSYVVTASQRVKGRIKVILVNEDLGY